MTTKRPNFLVIVADDLGFSDVGCFGGEIRTPNIDKLASQGHRFTEFHAAAACSPTRAMIMTGTDHHIAGLGNLIEWTMHNGQNTTKGGSLETAPQRGMPGYEGYLNERVAALPEIMRDGGYHTIMSGKWHLGLTPDRSPHTRGFKRSFAHLPACSNHFAYTPDLKEEQPPRFLEATSIPLHMEDDHYVKELPDGWYSSDGYGDIMLKYLEEWKGIKDKDKEGDHPFFGYFPFTAPHWPLQAPQKYIKNYRGVYDDGPDALRLRRLERLKKMGLVPEDVKPHPVVAEDSPEWADMTPEQRAKSCRAMECFAGMVECIDANVGKVVDYLESIGEMDNTFICFLSDNGAEGAAYEAYPIVQTTVMEHLKQYYDNSLDNLGNGNSFIWYGPRWAQASTAPSRLYKAFTTEGGIRVPFVVKYPKQFEPMAGGEAAQPITHKFATVMDLAPTVIEMAGLTHPAPTYQGREVVRMRGESFVPFLRGERAGVHDAEFIQGWETCGRAAIRKGDWKAVWIPKPKGPDRWQLYDLSRDKGEIEDLSGEEPERMKELLKLWDDYVLETGIVTLCPDQGRFVDAMEEQMTETGWMEYEHWHKGAQPGGPNMQKFMTKPPRFQRTVNQI